MMNSWKMKLSRISCKSRVYWNSLSLPPRCCMAEIFYILCCLFMHRFVGTAIVCTFGFGYLLHWCRYYSVVRRFLHSSHFFLFCLHSNLIVFFVSLRYAWSTTLNYRKLHIFSLFPYWMVSVMSLLFLFHFIWFGFLFISGSSSLTYILSHSLLATPLNLHIWIWIFFPVPCIYFSIKYQQIRIVIPNVFNVNDLSNAIMIYNLTKWIRCNTPEPNKILSRQI